MESLFERGHVFEVITVLRNPSKVGKLLLVGCACGIGVSAAPPCDCVVWLEVVRLCKGDFSGVVFLLFLRC